MGPPGPRLIVVGGLPGVGKTTVCRKVLGLRPMAWLRIDSIEQALRDSGELLPAAPAVPATRWPAPWPAMSWPREGTCWPSASTPCP